MNLRVFNISSTIRTVSITVCCILLLAACRKPDLPPSEPKPKVKTTSIKKINKTLIKMPVAESANSFLWADSILKSMTLEEKIGQLFMVAAYSNRDEEHVKSLEKLVTDQSIGGVIFFQGGPVRQAVITNRLQKKAKVPLMVGIDAEWGLGMRLDSTLNIPKQMTMGAVQDKNLIYQAGKLVGRNCHRLGIHINFAPVVDVNVNPANPIIGVRSFGEDTSLVKSYGFHYMKGMKRTGVLTCAKHFPGHGDTDVDSHKDLPVIPHSIERIKKIEMSPFRHLFKHRVDGVMIAHLSIPSLEPRENRASTLSQNIVTGWARDKMDYKGLIFTDALNMKGVAKYFEPGEVDLEALKAGNDVLLFPEDVPKAVEKIKQSVETKDISTKEIDAHVLRILFAKYRVGLSKPKPVEIQNLNEDLKEYRDELLIKELHKKSLVVLRNLEDLIPIQNIDAKRILSIEFGDCDVSVYQQYLDYYTSIDHEKVSEHPTETRIDDLRHMVEEYDLVLLSYHKSSTRRRPDMKFNDTILEFGQWVNEHMSCITTVLANPYTLKDFGFAKDLILGHISNAQTQEVVPQLIFGAIGADGKIPVTAGDYKYGSGLTVDPIGRIEYSYPEKVGMDSRKLNRIDSIMEASIKDTVFPGGVILVARKGKIIFHKPYGYQTYDRKKPVNTSTIYDIASVTKIAATLPAFMWLEERGEVDVNKKASDYLPSLKNSNKKNMYLRDVLTHQAGLRPYQLHWRRTVKDKMMKEEYYCTKRNDTVFCNVVMPGVYSIVGLEDSIWKWTVDSRLLRKRRGKYKYKYSDLAFYMVKRIVERKTNQPLEDFVDQNLFRPLGMSTTGYNPMDRFPLWRIAPTELDSHFRMKQIHGTVHDEGAAMMGGVGGHAGLFSTANDLTKILQTYLNGGTFAGKKYFNKSTVDKFSAKQFDDNRRGLGFDRPQVEGGPTSRYVSMRTFGHSGFTGIGVWVDPDFDLIYIFMTNRVYPDARNTKLQQQNTRIRVHDIVYESIFDYEKRKK